MFVSICRALNVAFLEVHTEDVTLGNSVWCYARWFTLRKCSNYAFSFLCRFASGHFTASNWTDLQAEQAGEAEKRTHVNNAGNAPINACHCQSLAQCNYQTSDGKSDRLVPCSIQLLKSSEANPVHLKGINGKLMAARQYWSSSRNSCCWCSPVLSSCLSQAEAANTSCTCRKTDHFALAGLFVVASLAWAITSFYSEACLIKLTVGFNSSLPPVALSFLFSFQGTVKIIHNPLPWQSLILIPVPLCFMSLKQCWNRKSSKG